MANNWFLAKISYGHIDEKGNEKKTIEQYLVDALSYTEAESRIYKKAEEMIPGDFSIKGITKQNIGDVFFFAQAEKWYKCKVVYTDIQEKTGKEVTATVYMMVEANSIRQADTRLEEQLSNMAVAYACCGIQETPILEIYPYKQEESVDLLVDKMKK